MPTYFNEKSHTWYCKFYYRDYLGKSRQKKKGGFRLQRDAKEWEKSFIRQHEGQSEMTFAELYALYAEDMAHRLRESTLITKEHLIKTKLLPYFGEMPINQIKPATIRQWQNTMKEYRTAAGKGYSETYLKSMNNQLAAIFNYAMRYYRLSVNPCHTAGSMGKNNARQKQFWSPQEFHRFLSCFSEENEAHLIFSLLYYTGIRIGELLALTYEDFRLKKGFLIVNKSYHRIHKQDCITPPKTAKSNRVVALPEFLQLELSKCFDRHGAYIPSDRVFSSTKYYIMKHMREACLKTGLPRIRIHDLRHSHASLLMEMGCSPLLIAERLGHENIETTLNVYSHLYPDKQKELAEKLQILYQTFR